MKLEISMKHSRTITMSGALAGVFLASLVIFPHTIETLTALEAPATQKATDPFSEVALQAKAAFVYDAATNEVLYARNEAAPLPLASITKIMTAITAADLAPRGTIVKVTGDALREDGDSGLFGSEEWQLGDLLRFSLVVSSNDGMAAVAAALGSHENLVSFEASRAEFIHKMNAKAMALGLTSLTFKNVTGLDESPTEAGAYGSAKDVAMLLKHSIEKYGDIMGSTRYERSNYLSISNIPHQASNTDEIVGTTPGFIAGKTGYSDLAGGNLAVAFDAGIQHPVVVVVLGSTYGGRFQDVEKLVEAAIAKLSLSAV